MGGRPLAWLKSHGGYPGVDQVRRNGERDGFI
jgi:hypothetical protein